MLRNRAVFAVGAGALLVLSLASPTHAAPKANQLGPEVALAAPKDGYVGRLELAPLHGPVGSVGDDVTLVRDRRLGVRLIRRILGDAELFIDADLLIPQTFAVIGLPHGVGVVESLAALPVRDPADDTGHRLRFSIVDLVRN